MVSRLQSVFDNPYKKVNINWFYEKYYKHLSAGKIRSHKVFGKDFFFCSPQEFLHGLKEIFVEELYKQELNGKSYIIDCGANMGMSIIYLKRLCPDAEIIGFEPDETNFDLLTRNIGSYGFKDITIKKEAVWKEDTVLHFSNAGSMSSKIVHASTGTSLEVKAIRLKTFLTRPVDFLKMDIEGAEFEVIMDAAESLFHVKNLFIEYHGCFDQQKELSTLLNMLSGKGFNYYIKEAASVYDHPFSRVRNPIIPYDIQLNIFCFRSGGTQ
ncbi:MAG TPA: FkbM family methyltransferase [Puia sp.]|nr:FkbM family methyltransferase [Puia sp.]